MAELASEARLQVQEAPNQEQDAIGERGGACGREERSAIAGLIDKVIESSMPERVRQLFLV